MHCMDCGTKLELLIVTNFVTSYHCDKCEIFWYQKIKQHTLWEKSKRNKF